MKTEFTLLQDNLGRRFRVVPIDDGPGWCEADYPCNGCQHGVFDRDRYCCLKLPHGWDDVDEFHGTTASPFREVLEAAKNAVERDLDLMVEDIEFYSCLSRNSK